MPAHQSNVSRRTYLRNAAAAGIGGVTFASPAAARRTSVAPTVTEQTVYNVVDEGADPTGTEPVDDVLNRLKGNNVTLEFPSGRYALYRLKLSYLENFTMRGLSDDVVLVPTDDYYREWWIAGHSMRNITFENFVLDHTAENVGPELSFGCYDGLVVRNVTKLGYHDTDSTAFGCRIYESTGSGLVENLVMNDGSIPVKPVGFYTDTTGKLTVRNCQIAGFGNNGLYASTGSGPVCVEGGIFRNNDRTQVRLGGPGSYVKDAEIIVDTDPNSSVDGWTHNYRGIRVSDNPGPVLVENCDIKLLRGRGFGAIVNAFDGGSLTVRDTRIYVSDEYLMYWSDHTGPAVFVDYPSDWEQSGQGGERLFENVSITGDGQADGEYPVVLLFRGNSTFRNCCLHQTGIDRAGFETWDHQTLELATLPDPTYVVDSTVDVPGEVARGSVELSNITTEGTCPLPTGLGDSAGPTFDAGPTATDTVDDDGTTGDFAVDAGDTVRLEATVSDASGVGSVVADASSFGGPGSLDMVDDGSGTYTGEFVVGATSSVTVLVGESATIPVTATDASAGANTTTAQTNALTVEDNSGGTVDPTVSIGRVWNENTRNPHVQLRVEYSAENAAFVELTVTRDDTGETKSWTDTTPGSGQTETSPSDVFDFHKGQGSSYTVTASTDGSGSDTVTFQS